MKILLIEDDRDMLDYVGNGLAEYNHVVDRARDGRDGLSLAGSESYDLIVVDRMLPGVDGLVLVKMVRAAGVQTPILFLTALGDVYDRVDGLDAGGDDYLVKPFAFAELIARVNALARRPRLGLVEAVLTVADLEVDVARHKVTRAGRPIELQRQEFRLLEYLMRHAGRVVTRTMLLESVWDFHFDPRSSIVESNISRLRAKIDRGAAVALIHTVRGAGYSLHEPG